MKKYKIYAAGRFVETAQQLEIRRPYDGRIFAKVGIADPIALDECIMAAQRASSVLRKMPSFERSSILSMISDGMQDRRILLAEVLCQETAKPLKFAVGEIDRAIQTVKVASEEARRIQGEYLSLDWTPAGAGKEGWVKYFPLGVIGAISPFNFPLNLSVHKLAPALAAGNAIILKPASQTPATVLELAEIIDATPLPKGAVSILPMSRQTGSALATDPRINLLTFTGSPEVGWSLKSMAGKKKVVLELGGNAGVLVSHTADLEVAAKKCVAGGFSYSGQVCIHVQRIFVEHSVFDSFCHRFIEHTKELRAGDPLDPDTDISAMIDEPNALRVEQWINEAVEAGARVLIGGKRTGSYVEPTVITGTRSEMKVCGQEVFGPVVTIDPIDSLSEGVIRINDSKYGLQAGVFTNDLREMNEAFSELQVGGVVINDVPTFRVDHMPYGGIKDSGLGREGVRYAILEMMEPKLLVRNY
jgi:acyl-CoA reductase-like NAD-dependent aldehyde dehydrogenase